VGKRLGLTALAIAYGKERVHTGPTFKKMTVSGKSAILEFDNPGGSLVTKDKYGYIRGFQVAGKDRQFYWAKAWIAAGKVIVQSDQVEQPVAVRYAWSTNPGSLDLYNEQGLPAAPFRTDDWRGNTYERKFDATKPRF
jgi:sialate O-acetylesterase